MKKIIFLGISVMIMLGCVSTRKPLRDTQFSVDPVVQKWIKLHKNSKTEKIAVIVKTSRPLEKYKFLQPTAENYYTGTVNASQLKRLFLDPYIIRISAGKQKLYVPAKPQAPGQPVK